MRSTVPGTKWKSAAPLGLAMLGCMLLPGCSAEKAVKADAGPKRTASSGKAAPEDAPAPPRKSVFKIAGGRDPFYPEVKAEQEKPGSAKLAASQAPTDPASLLRAGFQGIIGTSGERLAVVHGAILEAQRSTVISARAGGKEYKVAVRCLDVARDSVTVQVEGQARPITITFPKLTQF